MKSILATTGALRYVYRFTNEGHKEIFSFSIKISIYIYVLDNTYSSFTSLYGARGK